MSSTPRNRRHLCAIVSTYARNPTSSRTLREQLRSQCDWCRSRLLPARSQSEQSPRAKSRIASSSAHNPSNMPPIVSSSADNPTYILYMHTHAALFHPSMTAHARNNKQERERDSPLHHPRPGIYKCCLKIRQVRLCVCSLAGDEKRTHTKRESVRTRFRIRRCI